MTVLNQDQRNAFMDVISFLNDPTRKFHRISGGAGTGKSFFITEIAHNVLKHVNPEYKLNDVILTATTNKATAVLKNKLSNTSFSILTTYSFMNLRVQNNYQDGTETIVPTPKWTVHDKILLIVDEASMVTAKLMSYIEKGTSNTCKVLFVGDKNQLAPVKENISPVYSRPYTESLLTQPVRNANQQALMDLCDQLKDTVQTGVFHPIDEKPGVIDFVNGPQLQGVLEREYHQENHEKRVLAYTNQRVKEYNHFIRQLRGYTDTYHIGEFVINHTSAELDDKSRLYTDQVVQIVSKGPVYTLGDLVPGHDIELIDLEVRDPETNGLYEVTVFVDPFIKHEVMKYWKSYKKWDRYFKIKEKYPDLRSVAASTTHKAQGSTYESVVVDLSDIGKSTQKDQTARLLYVALSRPRNHLYIRGQLPERYFK